MIHTEIKILYKQSTTDLCMHTYPHSVHTVESLGKAGEHSFIQGMSVALGAQSPNGIDEASQTRGQVSLKLMKTFHC